MEETLLTWNFTNWVTVVLMAALGFLALVLIAQAFHAFRGSSGQKGGGGGAYSVSPASLAASLPGNINPS